MDGETRLILTMKVSKHREVEDARKVFAEAKETAKKKPRTEHIGNVGFRDKTNNSLIERFHGTVKERDKVMRALDNDESAKTIVDGFRIYYNY